MFGTLNGYIWRNLLTALILVTTVLATIILLTQSMKFLELVLGSGAAGSAFWLLTLLALPRFLEIILPIALAISVIFIYTRMMSDNELSVLRGSGLSPIRLAMPALALGAVLMIFLYSMTLWLTPLSMHKVDFMKDKLKTEFSAVLFKEGIFNRFGNDITVFIRNRGTNGELYGLIVHDKRDRNQHPVTITARSGKITTSADGKTQITVYDGARQDYDPKTHILNRLNFERYNIDLPSSKTSLNNWQDADERTTAALLNPDFDNPDDVKHLKEFRIELHRRLIAPLLTFTFLCISLPFLLVGPQGRQGVFKRVMIVCFIILILQALYLTGLNLAKKREWLGLSITYIVILLPIAGGVFFMSRYSEKLRQLLLYRKFAA